MDENLTAAAAGAAPLAPPLDWFTMDEADEPTPLTVTADGQIYGHAALWPTCHTGFQGKCVQPPKSPSGYSYFHLGQVITAEGEPVAVGKITMDTGHANIAAGAQTALSHYDNTGTTAAYVRAQDGKHGIWVSGAVRSDAPAEKAAMLRGSSVSGDWRRPRPGSPLEMIGLLAVNVPGFPVPRSQALTAAGDMLEGDLGDEELFAMVAAGFPEPVELTDEQVLRKLDILEARSRGLDFLADLVFAPEELAMRALSAASGKPMAMCGSCKNMVAAGSKTCPECGARMKQSPMDSMQAAAKNPKIEKVMAEFKAGKLKSGGKVVTDRQQAIAIALSEARKGRAVTAAGFDPSKHPREPAGSHGGGQWAFSTGDRVVRRHDKSATPARGTVQATKRGGNNDERHLVRWDDPKRAHGYYSVGELKKAAPVMSPAAETHYPAAEGGHPRGWGMGPAYKLKDEQQVGRPGGVAPAKKATGGTTSTRVTRSAGKIRKSGL